MITNGLGFTTIEWILYIVSRLLIELIGRLGHIPYFYNATKYKV